MSPTGAFAGYTDDEVIEAVNDMKAHGHGEINLKIVDHEVRQVYEGKQRRKRKVAGP